MTAKRSMIFIHAFLALQVCLPLGYYTCRADGRDERFAWRMFSPTRMDTCQVGFTVGEPPEPIELGGTFHEAWIEIAKRGRKNVIDAMGQRLCSLHEGQIVRATAHCWSQSEIRAYQEDAQAGKRVQLTDYGESLAKGVWDICKTGSL